MKWIKQAVYGSAPSVGIMHGFYGTDAHRLDMMSEVAYAQHSDEIFCRPWRGARSGVFDMMIKSG